MTIRAGSEHAKRAAGNENGVRKTVSDTRGHLCVGECQKPHISLSGVRLCDCAAYRIGVKLLLVVKSPGMAKKRRFLNSGKVKSKIYLVFCSMLGGGILTLPNIQHTHLFLEKVAEI